MLAGCSGSITSTPAPPARPAPASQAPASPPSTASLAREHGLHIVDEQGPSGLATDLAGATDGVGHLFDIATFDNPINRDDWARAAVSQGGRLIAKGTGYAIVRLPKGA